MFGQKSDAKKNRIDPKLVGSWWVDNGKFYELHKADGKTDVYTYEVLDGTHVKFKEDHMSIKQVSENYEFVDTKMED